MGETPNVKLLILSLHLHVDFTPHEQTKVCVLTDCIFFCPQWKSLSKEEQAKYYIEAEGKRMIHSLQYPEWSAKDNYVSTPCSHTSYTYVYITVSYVSDVR